MQGAPPTPAFTLTPASTPTKPPRRPSRRSTMPVGREWSLVIASGNSSNAWAFRASGYCSRLRANLTCTTSPPATRADSMTERLTRPFLWIRRLKRSTSRTRLLPQLPSTLVDRPRIGRADDVLSCGNDGWDLRQIAESRYVGPEAVTLRQQTSAQRTDAWRETESCPLGLLPLRAEPRLEGGLRESAAGRKGRFDSLPVTVTVAASIGLSHDRVCSASYTGERHLDTCRSIPIQRSHATHEV